MIPKCTSNSSGPLFQGFPTTSWSIYIHNILYHIPVLDQYIGCVQRHFDPIFSFTFQQCVPLIKITTFLSWTNMSAVCNDILVQFPFFTDSDVSDQQKPRLKDRIWNRSRFTPFPKITLLEIIITLIVTYFVTQTALLLILHWDSYDINSRPELFANLSYNLFVFLVTMEVFFVNGRLRIFMQIIESEFKVTGLDVKLTEQKLAKVGEMEETSLKNSKALSNILLFFCIGYSFNCVHGILMCVYRLRSFDELPITFSFFLPASFTKTPQSGYLYIFIALLQCWYLYFGYIIVSVLYSSRLFAYNSIFTEIELFLITLEELNQFQFENERDTERGNQGRVISQRDVERLKKIIRTLGEHHQTCFKKISMFEEGGRYHLFYVNASLCSLLCLAIFCTQRVTSHNLKIRYGLLALSMLAGCMVYSENGQRLMNRGEKTRKAIYECSWIDKPIWVQKTLLIMMMRNTQDIEINFYGIFKTNRSNVSSLLQAAYSYFSFLNNTN
ncbi:hypothetical protein LSTR_LSTR008620 [Laodelphax striatellus]|uniref:Odorant receptor n=1 Tax=Laodelphax striatellus TaxID=195883 RepID=A0A482X135_LAOST|nr:hypothetical protein LSTR_LSTR008620 [Laodelphax striatellus]